MYVLVLSLTLLGFISKRNQVCGDFINPLNYIRYERAVIRIGELLSPKYHAPSSMNVLNTKNYRAYGALYYP